MTNKKLPNKSLSSQMGISDKRADELFTLITRKIVTNTSLSDFLNSIVTDKRITTKEKVFCAFIYGGTPERLMKLFEKIMN